MREYTITRKLTKRELATAMLAIAIVVGTLTYDQWKLRRMATLAAEHCEAVLSIAVEHCHE